MSLKILTAFFLSISVPLKSLTFWRYTNQIIIIISIKIPVNAAEGKLSPLICAAVIVFHVVLHVLEMESAVLALDGRYFAGRAIIARPYHEQSNG